MTVQSDSSLNQIYLAFDIHDVLAVQKADNISAPLFQAYGTLLQVPVEGYSQPIRHYVYPFVKELFQLLAETPGAHFAFFTSSQGIFAKPFVRQLLIKTLGQEEYERIADRVRVCAKEQLKPDCSYKNVPQSRYCQWGRNRKDLDDVYPGEDIPQKQRVLIDDDRSFAPPHQVKNLFCVSGYHWTDKLRSYQRFGYYLYFFSSADELDKSQSFKKPGKSIALCLKQTVDKESSQQLYVVVYYDKEVKKEIEMSLEESKKIQELFDKSILESSAYIYTRRNDKEDPHPIVEEIQKMGLEKPSDVKQDRFIEIYGEGVKPKKCMKTASRGDVAIHLREGDAHIYFPQNPEVVISLRGHGSLKCIELAREFWDRKCRNKHTFLKEGDKKSAKAQLYDLVWDKVKDLVWKEKIIKEANHVLLITGAIFDAWEESKTTQKPISKILFNGQCEDTDGCKEFSPWVLQKRSELYLKGLELLRQVNPQLEPITIKSFESALVRHPTLPDDGAVEHNDGCVIS